MVSWWIPGCSFIFILMLIFLRVLGSLCTSCEFSRQKKKKRKTQPPSVNATYHNSTLKKTQRLLFFSCLLLQRLKGEWDWLIKCFISCLSSNTQRSPGPVQGLFWISTVHTAGCSHDRCVRKKLTVEKEMAFLQRLFALLRLLLAVLLICSAESQQKSSQRNVIPIFLQSELPHRWSRCVHYFAYSNLTDLVVVFFVRDLGILAF